MIDVVRQIFPGAGHSFHIGLSAQLAYGADLAGHAGDFGGKGPELIDHGVDGIFEFQNFSPHIDRDLLRQVAVGHSRRDGRDVAHLPGQIAGHRVDAVGQVFPGASDATHMGLAAEFALGADFTGDARHLRSERAELVHHGIDGVFQLQDFTFDIDGDFLGQVPIGHSRGHSRNVSHLAGKMASHRIDAVGQVLPSPGHPLDIGLTAEFAFSTDFTGDAGDFGGKRTKLVHHGINGVFQFEDFPFDIDGDFFGQVTVGHGRGHGGDVAHLGCQVAGHRVHAISQILPRARHAPDLRLATQFPFRANFAGDASHLGSK